MGDRMVGIDALAASLRLSKSTVSRALNGYPDIAEKTKERVRRAAADAGYKPSSLASRLRRGRVETVGVVLSGAGCHLTSPHLAAFLSGVATGLDSQGLDLLVATPPAPDAWRAVYDRLIDGRKADGFVVIRTETDDARIRWLRERGAPFVSHGRTLAGGPFAWVDVDNAAAGREAAAHLAALGHRRIAHIAAPMRYTFSVMRRDGYRQGLAEAGLDADPALELEAELQPGAGAAEARRLLALERPPTAVFCSVDAIAMGAMAVFRAAGLRIGSDISVIGYDNVPMADACATPLTTFDQESAAAGEAAAATLARLLAGAPIQELQILRRARLVRRASDGPPALTSQELRRRLDAAATPTASQGRTT